MVTTTGVTTPNWQQRVQSAAYNRSLKGTQRIIANLSGSSGGSGSGREYVERLRASGGSLPGSGGYSNYYPTGTLGMDFQPERFMGAFPGSPGTLSAVFFGQSGPSTGSRAGGLRQLVTGFLGGPRSGGNTGVVTPCNPPLVRTATGGCAAPAPVPPVSGGGGGTCPDGGPRGVTGGCEPGRIPAPPTVAEILSGLFGGGGGGDAGFGGGGGPFVSYPNGSQSSPAKKGPSSILILLLLGAAALGYYLYKRYKKQ